VRYLIARLVAVATPAMRCRPALCRDSRGRGRPAPWRTRRWPLPAVRSLPLVRGESPPVATRRVGPHAVPPLARRAQGNSAPASCATAICRRAVAIAAFGSPAVFGKPPVDAHPTASVAAPRIRAICIDPPEHRIRARTVPGRAGRPARVDGGQSGSSVDESRWVTDARGCAVLTALSARPTLGPRGRFGAG